jgi:hypothetical protein
MILQKMKLNMSAMISPSTFLQVQGSRERGPPFPVVVLLNSSSYAWEVSQ